MGDWHSGTYIASQILLVVSYTLFSITYFIGGRQKLLTTNIANNILMGIGYGLLGGWVAVGMCSIAVVRDITSSIMDKLKPENCNKTTCQDWFFLFLWISLFATVALMTAKSFISIIPVFATIIYTISIWQKNILVYKIMGIFRSVFWIIYNIWLANVVGFAWEIGLLISIIIGLIIYIRKNKITKIF